MSNKSFDYVIKFDEYIDPETMDRIRRSFKDFEKSNRNSPIFVGNDIGIEFIPIPQRTHGECDYCGRTGKRYENCIGCGSQIK